MVLDHLVLRKAAAVADWLAQAGLGLLDLLCCSPDLPQIEPGRSKMKARCRATAAPSTASLIPS